MKLMELRLRAEKVHAVVCDLCCDSSEMNDDGTCRTCIDDLHEAELVARGN